MDISVFSFEHKGNILYIEKQSRDNSIFYSVYADRHMTDSARVARASVHIYPPESIRDELLVSCYIEEMEYDEYSALSKLSDTADGLAEIFFIEVERPYRSDGIGRILMETILDGLLDDNHYAVSLNVSSMDGGNSSSLDNNTLEKWYASFGFRTISNTEKHYMILEDAANTRFSMDIPDLLTKVNTSLPSAMDDEPDCETSTERVLRL